MDHACLLLVLLASDRRGPKKDSFLALSEFRCSLLISTKMCFDLSLYICSIFSQNDTFNIWHTVRVFFWDQHLHEAISYYKNNDMIPGAFRPCHTSCPISKRCVSHWFYVYLLFLRSYRTIKNHKKCGESWVMRMSHFCLEIYSFGWVLKARSDIVSRRENRGGSK